jgi:hypothetical protein
MQRIPLLTRCRLFIPEEAGCKLENMRNNSGVRAQKACSLLLAGLPGAWGLTNDFREEGILLHKR